MAARADRFLHRVLLLGFEATFESLELKHVGSLNRVITLISLPNVIIDQALD